MPRLRSLQPKLKFVGYDRRAGSRLREDRREFHQVGRRRWRLERRLFRNAADAQQSSALKLHVQRPIRRIGDWIEESRFWTSRQREGVEQRVPLHAEVRALPEHARSAEGEARHSFAAHEQHVLDQRSVDRELAARGGDVVEPEVRLEARAAISETLTPP